jgi:hypothetical protein
MRTVGNSSTWRAIFSLAWGLSLICLPREIIAEPLTSPGSIDGANEPFGLSTAKVTTGALLQKWLDVIGHDGVKRYAHAPSISEGSRGEERAVGQILH